MTTSLASIATKLRRFTSDPAGMTAGKINVEFDRLDALRSEVNDMLIASGRGHETYNETWTKTDPIALVWRSVAERGDDLRNEISRRYGPGAPSRLPTRGFGPIKAWG
jgi:hypothetical protein